MKRSTLRNHLVPRFGKMRVDRVDAEAIEAYASAKLSEGKSPKTINNHLTMLRKLLAVRLNMPDIKTGEDVLRAYSAMLKAMSDAHITPDEASTVSGVLDQNRRALETVEIEERIASLEKKIGEQK